MNLGKRLLVMLAALAIATFFSAKTKILSRNRIDENGFPRIVLWAWERPEDLSPFDPQRFAVAFLAQTLILKGDDVVLNPRRQPLSSSRVNSKRRGVNTKRCLPSVMQRVIWVSASCNGPKVIRTIHEFPKPCL